MSRLSTLARTDVRLSLRDGEQLLLAFVLPIQLADGSEFKIGWPWYGLITGSTTIVVGALARLVIRPA